MKINLKSHKVIVFHEIGGILSQIGHHTKDLHIGAKVFSSKAKRQIHSL